MSFMKELYENIVNAVKELKANPGSQTYTNLEKLLDQTIPSDGSEDVIKYNMIKNLLKAKAILLNNIATSDIKYIFLWTTPEMIVRHFDLQNYIELTFVQSNRFVLGDFIRGNYQIKKFEPEVEPKNNRPRTTSQTPSNTSNSSNSTTTRTETDDYTVVSKKNRKPPRFVQSKTRNDNVKVRDTRPKLSTNRSQSMGSYNVPVAKTEPLRNSASIEKNEVEKDEPPLRSSINWGATSTKNWADSDSDSQ